MWPLNGRGMVEASLYDVILTSFFTSGTATILAVLIGLPLGAWSSRSDFAWLKFVHIFVRTLYGLPPVVVGVFVYLILSKSGPLSNLDWLFTVNAMILAQTILVLPIIWGGSWSAFNEINNNQKEIITTLGASNRQAFFLQLGLARKNLLNTIALGFGRAVAEVGAVFMVGGNIAGKTRVMTTSIVLETQQGNMNSALWLGLILLLLVCSIMALIEFSKLDAIPVSKKRNLNVGKVVLGSNYEGASSRHINIEFNGKKIVEDIVVNLSPGKIVAISGPSGSGKTSLLRELCGLGEGNSSTEYGKGTIGWVAQDFSAITSSVANEIALASYLHENCEIDEMEMAKRVGLQGVLFQHPNTLSGGELQRLALMRTLALSPSLLLLDEFTSNLDNESVILMEKQVNDAKECGAAIVLVSHDSEQIERLSDEVIEL